ncbi:MAG: glycosyltransferase family 9 protein [Planctomycetes bacterium]|nr:glycosyltransferase family 9 protein [Planctomycetota bacterium]
MAPGLRNPERILILRLSAVGDCLHTLPALHALRRHFPDAHIAWRVEAKARGAVEGQPGLDEVIVVERRGWRDAWQARRPAQLAAALGRHVGRLRAGRFDWGIDFQGNLTSGLHLAAAGIPCRIGFAAGACREGNQLFTNHHVHPGPARQHRIDKNLALLRGLGLAVDGPKLGFALGAEAQARIDPWLAATLPPGARFVAFHPSTSAFGAYKRWSPAAFARLGDLARARLGVEVVVTWGPGEEELAAQVAGLMQPAGHVACRTASLGELGALLARAAAFVGSDSAPLHLAAALGVPTVALFGPKDPVIYGPYRTRSEILWKGIPCSPCRYRRCPYPDCMKLITPLDACAGLERLLGAGAGAGAPAGLAGGLGAGGGRGVEAIGRCA